MSLFSTIVADTLGEIAGRLLGFRRGIKTDAVLKAYEGIDLAKLGRPRLITAGSLHWDQHGVMTSNELTLTEVAEMEAMRDLGDEIELYRLSLDLYPAELDTDEKRVAWARKRAEDILLEMQGERS